MSKFKVGDIVVCTKDFNVTLSRGEVRTVVEVFPEEVPEAEVRLNGDVMFVFPESLFEHYDTWAAYQKRVSTEMNMYSIQGKPKDGSEDWAFCTDVYDIPELFYESDGDCLVNLEEWQDSTPDWEYRVVEVSLIVKEIK